MASVAIHMRIHVTGMLASQAAHVAHVLRVLVRVRLVIGRVHGVDHRPGAEEQERLEEGVRHEVEDARRRTRPRRRPTNM